MATVDPNAPGPVELEPWPDTLDAHVVEAGSDPRIHGYSVREDLASHYGYAALVLLSAQGELPTDGAARTLEIALAFLAPISIAEAPAHATSLARLCGATSSAALSVAAVALAEQARDAVERHRPLLAWLDAPPSPLPVEFTAQGDDDARGVGLLRAAIAPTGTRVPILEHRPTLLSAILGTLHAAGLRTPEQIELAWLLARLPVVAAEAACVRPLAFRTYPMNTPVFRYEVDA